MTTKWTMWQKPKVDHSANPLYLGGNFTGLWNPRSGSTWELDSKAPLLVPSWHPVHSGTPACTLSFSPSFQSLISSQAQNRCSEDIDWMHCDSYGMQSTEKNATEENWGEADEGRELCKGRRPQVSEPGAWVQILQEAGWFRGVRKPRLLTSSKV